MYELTASGTARTTSVSSKLVVLPARGRLSHEMPEEGQAEGD